MSRFCWGAKGRERFAKARRFRAFSGTIILDNPHPYIYIHVQQIVVRAWMQLVDVPLPCCIPRVEWRAIWACLKTGYDARSTESTS